MSADKTALVLSAGGMFCAYQAGAWEVIAQKVPPAMVVGASAGALNAWPIAAGCAPSLLIEKWLDPASGEAMQLRPDAGWRNGWFQPEPLRRQSEKTFAEFRPRIPIGIVVVRRPQWKPVLIQNGEITARHLEATCAIPFLLPAVPIDGVRYVDGGLFNKLPVSHAVEMGATRIIAIDALPDVGLWWARILVSAVRAVRPRSRIPSSVELTLISPSEPLGSAEDAVFWKRENIERWIDLGRRDAAKALRAISETPQPACP